MFEQLTTNLTHMPKVNEIVLYRQELMALKRYYERHNFYDKEVVSTTNDWLVRELDKQMSCKVYNYSDLPSLIRGWGVYFLSPEDLECEYAPMLKELKTKLRKHKLLDQKYSITIYTNNRGRAWARVYEELASITSETTAVKVSDFKGLYTFYFTNEEAHDFVARLDHMLEEPKMPSYVWNLRKKLIELIERLSK